MGNELKQTTSSKECVFQCPLCNLEITNRYAIPMHFRWHHKGWKHCPKCLEVMEESELKSHLKMHKLEKVNCPVCGKKIAKSSMGGHMTMHNGTNGMKNPELHAKAMAKRSQNMEYRQGISKRMKANNPMRLEENREKVREAIMQNIAEGKQIAFGNARKHGNGCGMTPAESTMLELYPDAIFNLAVTVGDGQRPYHYKIDLAWPDLKIGLELDGTSHARRQAADDRKVQRLSLIGWKIVRAPNELAGSRELELRLLDLGITRGTSMT